MVFSGCDVLTDESLRMLRRDNPERSISMTRVDKAKRSRTMTDFEDGKIAPWVKEEGAKGVSIELVGGNHVFRVPLTVPYMKFKKVLSQTILTQKGQTYRFSLKARLHEEGTAYPVIALQVGGENVRLIVIDDTEWLTASIDFVASLPLTDLSIAGTYLEEEPGRTIELDEILVFEVSKRSTELA
jgi:hypothetical protein